MKNIIVVSREPNNSIIYNLLELNSVNIVACVVDSEIEKNNIHKKRPELNIYVPDDVTKWNGSYVSIKQIQEYYPTQLKVERYSARLTHNCHYILSSYYSALGFWINIFNSCNIDGVFIGQIEHGSPLDSIPIDIAKSHNIPVYIIEIQYAIGNSRYYSILDTSVNKYINIDSLLHGRINIDVHDIINPTVQPISIKGNRQNMLKIFVKFFKGVWIIGTHKRFLTTCQGIPEYVDYQKQLFSLLNMLSLKKYYEKHSERSLPTDKNYIVYALHFEPEASIQNRTTYNSQLYNITMLSSVLPEGWVLYVKEHPHQFRRNMLLNGGFLHSIQDYRNREFYDEIRKLPNVKLLSVSIPSSELKKHHTSTDIEKGLKAVSTINGTIALEMAESKIPTILYDADSTVAGMLNQCYSITSYDTLKTAIRDIENNKTTFTDTDIIGKYLTSNDSANSMIQELTIIFKKLLE